MPDNVIPLHRTVPLTQDDQAVKTFAIARVECEDCPAGLGQMCMWQDTKGVWHECRVLHVRRTNAARRLITEEAGNA